MNRRLKLKNLKKLKREISGLQFSIDNFNHNQKDEIVTDFYKDYRTGYPKVKTVSGIACCNDRLQKLYDRLDNAKAGIAECVEIINNVQDEELKLILEMHFLDGYDYRSIGTAMKMSKSSVERKVKEFFEIGTNGTN